MRNRDAAHPACRALLDYTADRVTSTDVDEFTPNDPGKFAYIRTFRAILDGSMDVPVPAKRMFDVTETVALSNSSHADEEADPARFRRFRAFANAVGAVTSAARASDHVSAGHVAARLIEDAEASGDAGLLALLGPAFAEMHDAAASGRLDDEVPFLTLALLIVGFMTGDEANATSLAERLIAEDAACSYRESFESVFGCTWDERLRESWRDLVRRHWLASGEPQLSFVRVALLTP